MRAVVSMVMNLRVSVFYKEGWGSVPDSVTDTVSRGAVTEQMCSTVFHSGACVSNFESGAICSEICRVFPQSLHSDAGIMPRNIMTSPFQFLSNSLLAVFVKRRTTIETLSLS